MPHTDDTLTETPPITAPVPIILAPGPRRARRVPRWLTAVAVVLLPSAALAGAMAGAPTELVRSGEVAAPDVIEGVDLDEPGETTPTGTDVSEPAWPGSTTTTTAGTEAPAQPATPTAEPDEDAPVAALEPAPTTTTTAPAEPEAPVVTAPPTTAGQDCTGLPVNPDGTCAGAPDDGVPPENPDDPSWCTDQGGTVTWGDSGEPWDWSCTIGGVPGGGVWTPPPSDEGRP